MQYNDYGLSGLINDKFIEFQIFKAFINLCMIAKSCDQLSFIY